VNVEDRLPPLTDTSHRVDHHDRTTPMPDLHPFHRESARHCLALCAITVKHRQHIDAHLTRFLSSRLTDILHQFEGDSDEIERDRTWIRQALRALDHATDHNGFLESRRDELVRAFRILSRAFKPT
jgi:hypothetical protein